MSNIAMRNNGSQDWEFVKATGYQDEAALRDLLVQEPALLPLSEIGINGHAPVAIKEFGLPGAGTSDVIVIDESGAIAIVECKLATNPERKRAVIGQVLDYASALHMMDFDEFDLRVRQNTGHDLESLIKLATQEDFEFDSDKFGQTISEALTTGSFSLVIAIDEMDEDLRRVLDYVSSRSKGELHIFGLSLRFHQGSKFEAIVPDISNPRSEVISTQPVTHWNAERFRAAIQSADVAIRPALSELLDFLLDHAGHQYWGTSESYGTFGYGVLRPNGRPMSLFTVYTNGTFYLNAGTLKKQAPVEIAERFIREVSSIPNMERAAESKTYPQFQIKDTLAEKASRDRLLSAVNNLVDNWS